MASHPTRLLGYDRLSDTSNTTVGGTTDSDTLRTRRMLRPHWVLLSVVFRTRSADTPLGHVIASKENCFLLVFSASDSRLCPRTPQTLDPLKLTTLVGLTAAAGTRVSLDARPHSLPFFYLVDLAGDVVNKVRNGATWVELVNVTRVLPRW